MQSISQVCGKHEKDGHAYHAAKLENGTQNKNINTKPENTYGKLWLNISGIFDIQFPTLCIIDNFANLQ